MTPIEKKRVAALDETKVGADLTKERSGRYDETFGVESLLRTIVGFNVGFFLDFIYCKGFYNLKYNKHIDDQKEMSASC